MFLFSLNLNSLQQEIQFNVKIFGVKQCRCKRVDCISFPMIISGITVGAICVYPSRVEDAVTSLKAAGASQIPVASGKYSRTLEFRDQI